MPAVPVHNTAVVDEPWNGPAEVAKMNSPVTGKTGKAMFAWYDGGGNDPDGDGYPDAKADWKLPHHQVSDSGQPGAANMAACRAAMSRLGQSNTNIPEADRAACRSHLQHHMDAFNNDNMMNSEAPNMDFEALMELTERVLSPVALVADEFVRTYMAREFADAENLAAAGGSRPGRRQQGQVAVIPLHGVITPCGSLLARVFGLGGGLEQFRAELAQALADDNVSSIVIDVDSPGGTVDLVPETAAEVLAARGNGKPIHAIANTMAASAAYWIASAADEVSVTPSGQVGSIGVFTVHEDLSRMAEAMGVKTTIISAGRFKTEGNPFEPLSKQAQQAMQTNVNDLYAMFVDSVAAGRKVPTQAVRAGFGEGRMVLAERAQALGMVNRVETLDEMITRLGGTPVQAGAADTPADLELAAVSEPSATHAEEKPVGRNTTAGGGSKKVLSGRLYGEDRREQPAWRI